VFNKIKTVFVGNALNAAFGFIATILLTRMLSVSDFGKYGYLYAFAMIAVTVLDFAAGTSFVVHYARKGMSSSILANYNAFRLGSLALLGIAGLLFFLAPVAAYSVTDKAFLLTLMASMSVSLHFQSFYQGAGRYRHFGVMAALNNASRLLFIAGLALFMAKDRSARLDTVMLVMCGAQAFAVAAAILLARRDMAWDLNFRFDRDFIRSLLYLGIGNILIIVTMRIDVFIIKHYLDYQSVGYYHVVFTLCSVFPLLTGSIMTVMVRELSAQEGEPGTLGAILGRQLKLLPRGMIVMLALVLLSRPLIELFFGSRYDASVPLLQVMLIPFSLGVIFTPLESYFYSRRPKIITIMKLAQMLATIVLSVLLIRAWGLVGIGYSTLLVRLTGWMYLIVLIAIKAGGDPAPRGADAPAVLE
jgi:O-antigen/teichoic acid export membrane protein